MTKKALFLSLLIFLIIIPAFSQEKDIDRAVDYIEAQDADDDVLSLFEIEKLIRATDYNVALEELHKYIEKYPDRFDNAQRLIKTIMNRRKRYSVLTEQAIKSSTENPEDHITPSQIILEMKTLEKNPPEEIQQVITMLEDLHLFKYYAYLFETIQNESSQLSQKNDVVGAITKVQEGFWIYKEEFQEEWADYPGIIREADKIESQLQGYITSFENVDFRKRFNNLVAAFIKNVDDDKYDAANDTLNQLQTVFSEYTRLRNNIQNCGIQYAQLFERQKKINPDLTDASYLPFMQRFVSGIASSPGSGIVGAIDYEYSQKLERMKNAVAKASAKYSQTYLAALPKAIIVENADLSGFEKSAPYINPITRYSDLGKKVNKNYNLLETETKTKYNPYPDYDQTLDYLKYISELTGKLYPIAIALNKENLNQQMLRADLKNGKNQENYNSSEYIRKLFDSVSSMSKITGEKQDLMPKNREREKTENCNLDWTANTDVYIAFVDEIFNSTQKAVVDSWSEISQSFIDDAASYESVITEYNKYAAVFHKGFPKSLTQEEYALLKKDPEALLAYAKEHEADKGTAAYYYPDLTLEMSQYMESVAESYEKSMSSAQTEFEYNLNTHSEWTNNKQITDIVNNSKAYMDKKVAELAIMRQSSAAAVQAATRDYNGAQTAKKEADKLYNDSVSAFNREEFEKAENLLVQASEKYTESLELKDDPELRSSVDKKQYELSLRITDARNEVVIKESRALYTRARNAQSIDNYDEAELLINQAIIKWAETHDEANEEFEEFRNLVNTAVSMKTGRILTVADPLYAEMSQLLSIAYQYYDKGRSLYNKNQIEEGDVALAMAVENLQKIKKVYPINQEASILMLRIDQLQDPAKFKSEFGQRIKEAVAKCKNAETQTEGYNELMTYYNLDPNYSGLKNTIYNIEIQLGMRQKPVDNSAAARARRLTEEAQSLYNSAGNDTAKLNRALDRVKQALALNPSYSTAEQLRDRIETKIGGSTVIVLSSSDTALLTRAKNEYQAGRIDEANLIMIQILKNNPQNAKVKSVADLKKKIDARL